MPSRLTDGRINSVIRISLRNACHASAFLLLREGHHFQKSDSLVNGRRLSRDACGLFALEKVLEEGK